MASNGTNGHKIDILMDDEKKAPPAPAPSVFTPVVAVLSFVCLGLLIAVITMAALISGDDGSSSSGGVTTVVCPGGAATPAAATPAADVTAATSAPVMKVMGMPPPPPPEATDDPTSLSTCPVETFYWEFPAAIYSGYKGCVSEIGIHPCEQDGYEKSSLTEENAFRSPIVYNTETGECDATDYTMADKTLWVLWGSPMDAQELIKRTGGETPVISFPFDRAPYPSLWDDAHGDESLSGQAKQKEFLQYINAFTADELDEFVVRPTEGAESGMIIMWGAKALEIARTTCNRDIYALMEVPAYGYSPSTSAKYANEEAASFYNGEECACYNTTTCNDPTVTISNVGWAPGTPLPVRTGADGIDYAADSPSPASPWFESLVFPENPSGTVKSVQLPDPNRRVCDGVYLYPMYFGGPSNWEVPDTRPDCSSWSFSITKAYSASVRAGHIMFKDYPLSVAAHETIVADIHNMANGLMSEWTWRGQVQLFDLMMEKPYTDPTSWVGAYKTIMEDKWNLVIDGFKDCPVIELVNDYQGAYAWFKKTPEYLGLEDNFITSLFRDTLGIWSTTYNWGFRGADPADMYGANYTVTDFTRMHLYRDISVYEEINRRAKIMCSGGRAAAHLLTYPEWAAAEDARINAPAEPSRRHALAAAAARGPESREQTRRRLISAVPHLSSNDAHLEHHVENHHRSMKIETQIQSNCSPEFSMSCMMKYSGGLKGFSDQRALL